MQADLRFYLFAIPAVVLVGLAKGGFTGLGAFGTPLLALGTGDPIRAAAVLLPILIAQDSIGVAAFRRTWSRQILAIMLPGAMVGIVLGYLFASAVSEAGVMALLGIISILFGAYRLWVEFGAKVTTVGDSPAWVGSLFGVATGFTSQIAHAGGPPFQMWVMPKKLERDTLIGTSAIFFAAVNLLKVPAYLALGQFTAANLKVSGSLLPIAALSSFAGVKLVRKVPTKSFYMIVYLLMILAGIKLVFDGF